MRKNTFTHLWVAAFVLQALTPGVTAKTETGFTNLFDGTTLNGWRHAGKKGEGYIPKEGIILCPKTGGGNLFTEKEYDNFIFRFEFKLTTNANNGIGIRAPFEG